MPAQNVQASPQPQPECLVMTPYAPGSFVAGLAVSSLSDAGPGSPHASVCRPTAAQRHGRWIGSAVRFCWIAIAVGLPVAAQSQPKASARTPDTAAVAAAAGTRLSRHVSSNPAYSLMKPDGWIVRQERIGDGFRITVTSPDGISRVALEAADNRRQRMDSAAWLAQRARSVAAPAGGALLSEVAVCRDVPPSCAVATVSFRERGVAMLGRYYVHANADLAVTRSYRAPLAQAAALRPLLLDVLTNLRVQGPKPLAPPLVERRASDGSLTISLPADWGFIGQRGAVIAGAPADGAGVIFAPFQVFPQSYGVTPRLGVIVSPYAPPDRFIHTILQQFRNRDTRVLATTPDRRTEAECLQQMGRVCDAADLQLSWVSPEGTACAGAFKVLNARPNAGGQWFSIVAGIWGPSDGLAEFLPLLERIAASFAIDDRHAKDYIRQGLANLKVLERQTATAVQGLYCAIEEGQRDFEQRTAQRDHAEAKWDDYRRGNSYWISDLEGGKVYQTDPWGTQDTRSGERIDGPPYNYIHFEGQNPRHPSEHMREISSDELARLNR